MTTPVITSKNQSDGVKMDMTTPVITTKVYCDSSSLILLIISVTVFTYLFSYGFPTKLLQYILYLIYSLSSHYIYKVKDWFAVWIS
jgi:hypothetical protein